MSELKPCPFCGGEARLVNCGSPMVVCLHGCCQIVDDNNSVERWNTRPIEDGLRAEITRRDEIITRLKEDAERLADIVDIFGDDAIAVLKHRALMKELE